MGEPVYTRFKIVGGNSSDCTQAASDPKKDPCKIDVFETTLDDSFILERSGDKYSVAPSDLRKVTQAFPSYSPPAKQIQEYLTVRSEFFKVLGDKANPAPIQKQIKIQNTGRDTREEVIENWTSYLTSFISHGSLAPTKDAAKRFQEDAIRIATYMSVDPTLDTLVGKTLEKLKSHPKLSAEAKKRVEWLLVVQSVREKMWQIQKPMMAKSQALSDDLKAKSSQIVAFLLANHLMADQGYAGYLYAESVKKTAADFDDILTKIDPSYDASQNYYAYMASVMTSLKKLAVPAGYRQDFQQRVSFVESEYQKKGREEMFTLLAAKPEEKAFREYLLIKYGEGKHRSRIMASLLKHMTVKSGAAAPSVSFDMAKAGKEIRSDIENLPEAQKSAATESLLALLKELFERNEKIEIYWNKKPQEQKSFYDSFPMMGVQKNALEELILWARRNAKNRLPELPDETPHVAIRKWTLTAELGIGAAGFGTAAALIPLDYSTEKYYGQGGAIILGGSGMGAAAGNLLSYALDIDKNSWLFDVGGALIGGVIAGTVYGLTVKPNPWDMGPPPPGQPDPGTKYPVDPYGP